MKAERRHELQTNTLAQFLTDLPLYIRFHANKILIGVIVICLLILLVRYRSTQAKRNIELVSSSLTNARTGINQLPMVDRTQSTDVARAQERRKLISGVNESIEVILNNASAADSPALLAEAYIARGDLNWNLAKLPPLAGASSQPGLELPQTRDRYLQEAFDAYQRVVTEFDAQKVAKASALFGMAAIEENRGNWDKAIAYYNALKGDTGVASVFQNIANQRVLMVPQIQQPVFLGTFSSTQPTTEPSTQPVEAAASQPATRPTTSAAQG